MRKLVYLFLIISGSLTACEDLLPTTDDPRDALTGQWTVQEDNSLKALETYTVNITKDQSDSTRLNISNFYNVQNSVHVTMNGSNLNIPLQTTGGFTFKGYGSVASNGKSIDWSYTSDFNGEHDAVTATYSK